MKGILQIAYKLLVNDKGKFAALLVGITIAVFLITMMTSMFAGILKRSSSTVINTGATVWVMDPAVYTVASSIPMPDYILDAVRSIDGVSYAVPLLRWRASETPQWSLSGSDHTGAGRHHSVRKAPAH